MITTNIKILCALLLFPLSISSYSQSDFRQKSPSVFQFNYKMIIKVDLNKRQQILKDNGESPTIFDKALIYINGDIHAANVIDIIERDHNKLKITSEMSPTNLFSYVIGDKKLKRESFSELSKNGYRTYSYLEKRGEAISTMAIVNYKKKNIDFFIGNKIERTEENSSDLSDMLTVVYESLSNPKKTKTLQINNSKSIKAVIFDEAELRDIRVNGKIYKARRYSKKLNSLDKASFDIWLDEETKVPLRYFIGLNENYGASMIFELESFKKIK